MIKKIMALFMIFAISSSAVELKVVDKNRGLFNEVDQSYDINKGWWWYEETILPEEIEGAVKSADAEIKKHKEEPKKIKYKVTPYEKKQLELAAKQLEISEKTYHTQQKILTILEYNFPRRAEEFGKDRKTGERCVANSSADCYVPMLIPEAQQVPVMAQFLKEPNSKNAKEYLKWQATYFNHMTDIGYGLNFAYKQFGKEAYPTETLNQLHAPNGGAAEFREGIEMATIKKLSKNIEIYVFLGKTAWFENKYGVQRLLTMKNGIFKTLDNFTYVYLDSDAKSMLENELKTTAMPTYFEEYSKVKSVVNKKMFAEYNIDITPTIVMAYNDPNTKKRIHQKISYTPGRRDVISTIYNFLVYNGIVKYENINEDSMVKLKNQYEGSGDGVVDLNAIEFELGDENSTKIKSDSVQITEVRK